MEFRASDYGPDVAAILAFDGDGNRLMPLAYGTCCSHDARRALGSATAAELFPAAPFPEAAFSGLWLYFSCLDESHAISQDIPTPEGSFWHGIMHRQEPDPGNAAYWFRRVGDHPIFVPLRDAAEEILARHPRSGFTGDLHWDPFAFIDFCGSARHHPDSEAQKAAMEIQRAEWQLLFDYCAKPRR